MQIPKIFRGLFGYRRFDLRDQRLFLINIRWKVIWNIHSWDVHVFCSDNVSFKYYREFVEYRLEYIKNAHTTYGSIFTLYLNVIPLQNSLFF